MFKRLKSLDDEILLLSNLLKSNGVDFYLIGFEQLLETERISDYPLAEKVRAIDLKEGELFQLIKNRLSLLKENLEVKHELAKALLLIAKITDQSAKAEFLNAIKKKKPIPPSPDNDKYKRLLTIFSRLGLYSNSCEQKFVIQRDVVWLEKDKAEKMNTVLSQLKEIEPQLQWKNAERQIKRFTEEEESEFAEIQKKYLDLINMRDAIINEYKKREETAETAIAP